MSGPEVLDAKNNRLQVGDVVERRTTTERLKLAVISEPREEMIGLVLSRDDEAAATVWGEEMMNGKFRALDLIRVSECCPTCGIERRHLDGAHSTALPHVDVCPDPFHGDDSIRRKRAEDARNREREGDA